MTHPVDYKLSSPVTASTPFTKTQLSIWCLNNIGLKVLSRPVLIVILWSTLNIFTCGSRSTSCNLFQSSNPEFLWNGHLLTTSFKFKSGVSVKLQSSVNEFQVQIRSFCEIAIFSQWVSRGHERQNKHLKTSTYSHQSDSSIFSISSREGPPGSQLLYSPLEKLDLLFSQKNVEK